MSSQEIRTTEEFVSHLELLKQLKYREGYANGVADARLDEKSRCMGILEEAITDVVKNNPSAGFALGLLREVHSKIEG